MSKDDVEDLGSSRGYAGLGPPQFYMEQLKSLRERNKYAKNWQLRIERKTNRHAESDGHPWGWWEVFPLGTIVGYWGSEREDLTREMIERWNKEAEAISA